MTLSEAVAKRVKQLLFDRKMTQYKLEQLSGLNHGTMTSFLSGRYKSCNLTTLVLIIRAFGMTAKEFFDSPLFDFENLEIEEK